MRRWPHSIETGEPFEMEFRLRRHDGVYHWFLTRVEPLRDSSGRVVRWYGSNVDINAQKRALERTKRIAETLQDMFLPKNLPQKPDVRFDAVYLGAEKDALVGGDWYDAFELPDGRLVFSIGDVAGHGLEASMSVGRLRQSIFTLAFAHDDPSAILAELDKIVEHQEPGLMVTALVGSIDPARQRLTYASAGHPAPLVAYSNDEPAEVLPVGGPPLGTGLGVVHKTHDVPLRPDAIIAVYTDGMVEFSRDMLTAERRLRTALGLLVGDTTIARPAAAVQELVFNEMPARDDAVLLLIQLSRVDVTALRSDPGTLRRAWRFHSSDAQTAHTSRRQIVSYLRTVAADAEELFACELILGEILSNTVEHAPGLVEVQLDCATEKPLLTVRDTGPGLKQFSARLPDDPLSEGGRGIFLINALADNVVVKPAPGYGTELRVVLPLRRRPLRFLNPDQIAL